MKRDDVIAFLKSSPDYVSGEEISGRLNVSRSAVWKVIRDLRGAGYAIEAVTRRGYRLLKSPDCLRSHEILSGLQTRVLGREIVHFEEVPSTMDVAMGLALEGKPEGTLVVAETQTKGRGRMGRKWSSPKGAGLYFSLVLRPRMSIRDVPLMTLMSAVAVCQAVRELSALEAKIKWPNDILIGGRKLSGILMELNADMDGVKFITLGIGLNVNTTAKHLPAHATSLKSETRRSFNRAEVLRCILKHLETWYGILQEEGSERVLNQWRLWSDTLGRRVRMEDQQGTCEGVALDIDEFGRLMIRNADGKVIHRMTGDVVSVK